MIGTGCGITAVHFSRAGVIGSGARLNCGTPTSLATVEIAIDGGYSAGSTTFMRQQMKKSLGS